MKDYVLYKDKTVRRFRGLINSGGGVFGTYRTLAVSFLRYAYSELDEKLAYYDKELDLNSIKLEQVFPIKYRWLVSNVALRTSREYLKNLEERITEFKGSKEDNLKLLVGVLFLKFVVITKLVEIYCQSLVNIKKAGGDINNITLDDLGISNQILKHYLLFQDLGEKSIDDWLALDVNPAVTKYFNTSMKRILKILLSVNEK